MVFAVVLYLFIALQGDFAAIVQGELIQGILKVLLFNQHALERLRVEAESGATLKAHVVGVQVDALEVLVLEVLRYVGGLGNGGINQLLSGSLKIERAHV